MNLKRSATATVVAILWSGAALAQDRPPEVQTLDAPAGQTPTGPEWWAFSRATNRHYLIDVHSIARTGDELTVEIARVSTESSAGDYSHTVDQFGIRCAARQSHVVLSSEASADGALEEGYATDEPWEAITDRSIDDNIRQIACDDLRPQGQSYPSVKAYIDAGRP
jgi:hypothetical protein